MSTVLYARLFKMGHAVQIRDFRVSRPWHRSVALALVPLAIVSALQSGAAEPLTEDEFRDRYGMRAENYFNDPLDVSLCKAIERNDLDGMRQAISQGANVNARGKGGITPLFWAFPYHRVERFELLLESGADPNLPLTGGSEIPSFRIKGETVTAKSAVTRFPDYFDLVVEHGADLSIEHWSYGPLPMAILMGLCQDKKHRLELYIDNGGDLSVTTSTGTNPAMKAAGLGYADLAIFLLEQGVDPQAEDIYGNTIMDQLATGLVHELSSLPPERQRGYFKLIDYLETRGLSFEESLKKTRFDISLYQQLRKTPGLAIKVRNILTAESVRNGFGDDRIQYKVYWPLRRFDEDPRVDYDIDSDNDDGFRYPENDEQEEKLEDQPGATGKLISPHDPHFTPTRLRLPIERELYGAGVDPHVKLTLDGGAGAQAIRLWNVPKHRLGDNGQAPIEQGGHRITLGRKYSLAQLNYEPDTGGITIFTEAVSAKSAPPADDAKRSRQPPPKAQNQPARRLTATVSKLSQFAELDDSVLFSIVPSKANDR